MEYHGRLVEAARTGNVEALHDLIKENPSVLSDYALVSPHENPLHVATKAGQLGFVREIIRLKPESAEEPNREGFRPLDIASVLGHVEIVKELVTSTGNDICRLKGNDGKTAIHYASISGRLEVMDELLSFSAECVTDVTVLGETALHLAVKCYKAEALRNLVEWLEKLGLEEIVNWFDKDGNSVLHLAVSRKQHEVRFKLYFRELKYTFQAGVNPPGGFVAEKSQPNVNSTNTTSYARPPPSYNPVSTVGLSAISAGLGSIATSDWFLLGNSLGFAASVNVLIYLTAGFPFQRELQISLCSMMFAYGWTVNCIQPKESARYLILAVAFLVPILVRWPPRWAVKLWRYYKTEAGKVNARG